MSTFCGYLWIPNPLTQNIPMTHLKTIVKKAITYVKKEELKEKIETYKKLKDSPLSSEDTFCRREYLKKLNLIQARQLFKYRFSMTEHTKMNK